MTIDSLVTVVRQIDLLAAAKLAATVAAAWIAVEIIVTLLLVGLFIYMIRRTR